MSFALQGIIFISTKESTLSKSVSSILFATEVYHFNSVGFQGCQCFILSHLNKTFSGAFGILSNHLSNVFTNSCNHFMSISLKFSNFHLKNAFIFSVRVPFIFILRTQLVYQKIV
jgi:hypothetical protein